MVDRWTLAYISIYTIYSKYIDDYIQREATKRMCMIATRIIG